MCHDCLVLGSWFDKLLTQGGEAATESLAPELELRYGLYSAQAPDLSDVKITKHGIEPGDLMEKIANSDAAKIIENGNKVTSLVGATGLETWGDQTEPEKKRVKHLKEETMALACLIPAAKFLWKKEVEDMVNITKARTALQKYDMFILNSGSIQPSSFAMH